MRNGWYQSRSDQLEGLVQLTKVDMLQSVSPFVAHQIEHLEQLPVVQILLGGDDVDHLVKLVLVVSLSSTGDISSDVDTGSVCREWQNDH